MDKQIRNEVVEKTKELMNAATCCEELKHAAQTWLNAIGTKEEASETLRYIEVLEESIQDIDTLIELAQSEAGIQYFGAELAKNIANHAIEIKAAGAKYCDCPACAAVECILSKKAEMMK